MVSYRVGVDVGGTFTDVLLVDDTTGAFQIAKTLTTPEDPSIGVLQAVAHGVEAAGIDATAVRNVIHGTTLVTNAIIQRTGARTALLTTAGFRDVLDIAHEHRYDMYDLLLEQPRPLVAREDRFEVDERLFADGTVYRPVDLVTVDNALDEIERRGIGAVAIVFLHAFRNPRHEKAVAERLAARAPRLRVSLSSEVAGEIREYERTSTTVANAYVQELVDRYLDRLSDELMGIHFTGRLFLMLSNGGIATAETAARFPVRLIESGPAAGALAAAHLGQQSGRPDLLSFDMGGTTAKACLIENGKPFNTNQFEVDRVYRFKPGSGLPIEAPAIDLIEIGAGGGSIARIDRFGLIKVGPESAGASPGPACYGLGGKRPTVTDADLVLGYLDADFFLGGQLKLDRAAAEKAIECDVAAPIGKSITAAAWAIHQTVNESMSAAARMHAVERGKDVRQYPLFAFGGAGPVHAYHVASILRLRQIIAPFAAGVGSTIGFLAAPLAFDFVRGAAGLLENFDWIEIDRLYADMEGEGRALLTAAQVPANDVTLVRTAEMRLAGQAHQITVPIPPGKLSLQNLVEIRRSFDEVYRRLFKRAAPGV
ncbi:MAG TPA: hydantoinase/oxoprolinase family protein, partial [Chloroflexota bacterium]|nr:hydantoinase/oxoprolinase family protein [Chloroflexota bacterium]